MNRKLLSIQVIRALAFILIFLSHVELVSTGPVGVSIFLVVSGFCLSFSYLDRDDKLPRVSLRSNLGFAVKKMKKLYPLHVITLIFVATIVFAKLVLQNNSDNALIEQGLYFIANGLLIHSWIPLRDGYFSFNAVSWYLSTIAFSYFVFPWILSVIQTKNKRKIITLAAISVGTMTIISVLLGIAHTKFGISNSFIKWFVYICPLYRFGDFVLGIVLGYIYLLPKKKQSRRVYTIIEFVAILIIILQIVIYGSGVIKATNWILTLFWLPSSLLLVYFFAVNIGMISRWLCKCKLLIWIGNISGDAFLIHQICIKMTEVLTKNKLIIAPVAFVLTIICTVIWRLLDKKSLSMLSRKKT